MSMTREEAAHILEYSRIVSENFTQRAVTATYVMALAALRFPMREQVERMRGEWVRHEGYDECANCSEKTTYGHNFCPCCGEPKTDEAVDMMLERWKEALENA